MAGTGRPGRLRYNDGFCRLAAIEYPQASNSLIELDTVKLILIVYAVPWLMALAGLSHIFFGTFTRLMGANIEAAIRLFDLAGILVAVGGLLGLLLAIIGWIGGNKAMMIHGLVAVALGASFAAKVLSGPANTNLHSTHQPPQASDSE